MLLMLYHWNCFVCFARMFNTGKLPTYQGTKWASMEHYVRAHRVWNLFGGINFSLKLFAAETAPSSEYCWHILPFYYIQIARATFNIEVIMTQMQEEYLFHIFWITLAKVLANTCGICVNYLIASSSTATCC